jgi:CheY-like chemotaxis protein
MVVLKNTCIILLSSPKQTPTFMKILIAEDEEVISMQYRIVLEERNHEVTITNNGEECIKSYKSALGLTATDDENPNSSVNEESQPPFDIVILDYRMPKKDGLAAAIEILELCPSQRIMFASAYTAETLVNAVKNLHRVVELLHKPFDLEYFVDAVEDKALYEQLERLNVRVKELKDHNITHSQLVDLLKGAKKLQNLALYSS